MRINKADREDLQKMLDEIKEELEDPETNAEGIAFYTGMACALYEAGLIDSDDYWRAVIESGADLEAALKGGEMLCSKRG